MKYNYQIMKESIKDERGEYYVPDYDLLRKNASCEEEIEYINDVENRYKKYKEKHLPLGCFAFNMVYVMKQACGHYEIFQLHVNNDKEAIEWLDMASKEAETRKCTRCICKW